MKKLIAILSLTALLATGCNGQTNYDQPKLKIGHWGKYKLGFVIYDTDVLRTGDGFLYLKWVVETNKPALELPTWGRISLYTDGNIATQTESAQVNSNLIATLVWKGKTNLVYLESIPVTNYVRKYHYERVRVYEQ